MLLYALDNTARADKCTPFMLQPGSSQGLQQQQQAKEPAESDALHVRRCHSIHDATAVPLEAKPVSNLGHWQLRRNNFRQGRQHQQHKAATPATGALQEGLIVTASRNMHMQGPCLMCVSTRPHPHLITVVGPILR